METARDFLDTVVRYSLETATDSLKTDKGSAEAASDSLETLRNTVEWLRHSGDCQRQSGEWYRLWSQGLSGDGWILSGDCQTVWRLSDSLETARDSPKAGINPVDTARDSLEIARDLLETLWRVIDALSTQP